MAAIAAAGSGGSRSASAAAAAAAYTLPPPGCGRYPLLQGTIKVQVILQIPPNAKETNKNIPLMFSSCSSLLHQANTDDHVVEGNYDSFGLSQFVNVPHLPTVDRKQLRQQQKQGTVSAADIEYAKTIHRRLQRKKAQINVFYDPSPPAPKTSCGGIGSPLKLLGGIFGKKKTNANACDCEVCSGPGSGSDDDDGSSDGRSNEAVCKKWKLLGKVMIDLSHFLENHYIAGDFPLVDTTRKELGGFVRLGIKTSTPYGNSQDGDGVDMALLDEDDIAMVADIEATTGLATNIDMKPYYDAMTFRPIVKLPPDEEKEDGK